MKKLTPFIIASLILLTACSTEFDVIDDYKETTVVYGLLDQNDSAHYIRINKAFLGEGNALIMAQQFDSLHYSNQLNIKLEQLKNNTVIKTFSLEKDSAIKKDPGVFSNPRQILYKVNGKVHKGLDLKDDTTYKLTIANLVTGNVIIAETPLISGFTITVPKLSSTQFDFAGNSPPASLNQIKRIEWKTGKNGRLYETFIRFNYTEINKVTNSKTNKFVDWHFAPQNSMGIEGGEIMEVSFRGEEFYKFIEGSIDKNSNVWRYPGTLDFVFSIASEEFNTYMEVNAPATGIVQEKPHYSNITNGVGLFSSRLRDNSRKNIKLSNNSLIQLYSGSYTSNLSFCDTASTAPIEYKCK